MNGRTVPYTDWSVYEIYKKMLKKVHGEEAARRHSLHDARRWAGTNFYFLTTDLIELARFMGHCKKTGHQTSTRRSSTSTSPRPGAT